ncbi:LOW QUALITY PROTEIN: hypothetical protein ACHAWF_015389 [Thalassiosira exigua]
MTPLRPESERQNLAVLRSNNGTFLAGAGEGGEGPYGNLHDRHPIRYPKRSGLYGQIEEGNENDGDDEEDGPGAEEGRDRGGAPIDRFLDRDEEELVHSSDEDGLFRRASRARDSALEGGGVGKGREDKSRDDFLDGLVASVAERAPKESGAGDGPDGRPTGREAGRRGSKKDDDDDDDDVRSVGDASFLSNLLADKGHARQRRGGTVVTAGTGGVTRGASETSSLTDTTATRSSLTLNVYRRGSGGGGGRTGRRGAAGGEDDGTTILGALRESAAYRTARRWWEEGGEVLPRTRREWAILTALAILLSPLMHVAAVMVLGWDGGGGGGGVRSSRAGGRGATAWHSSIYGGEDPESGAWAGSSQVMLSKSSSLRENFILIPDADWIELQLGPGRTSDGKGGAFRKKAPKPKRHALPSLLDPSPTYVAAGAEPVVVFTLTAANGRNLPLPNELPTSDLSKLNRNANANLWEAMRVRLTPRPTDAWPCWSHNSLARHREDGFAAMYPATLRDEAREALTALAREFGQSFVYEFATWNPGRGTAGEHAGGDGEGGRGGAGGVPGLPEGRSDVMIRRTVSTSSKASSSPGTEEPAVVMRRVGELPVEDELTMREWEGPPLEEVVWKA